MDELTQRALVRAAMAFAAVLVVGGSAVFALGSIGRGREEVASPSPSASPSASLEPAGPQTWLAWVPGGLPEGFGPTLTTVPEVSLATTATADIAWMTRSLDQAGAVVDDPTDPYMIPLDVTGVEPVFSSLVPEPERRLVEGLEPGEGILSESAAAFRGLGEGATLEFNTGASVVVVGTLPDLLMGGYELLVTRETGETIGVTRERYVLFHAGPDSDTSVLSEEFLSLLPVGTPFPAVEVRAPGETPLLRANDRELPPVQLKMKFGEFVALPGADGSLEIDPSWIQEFLVTVSIPELGTVQCHKKAAYLLKRAMNTLAEEGLTDLISDTGQCFVPAVDPDGPGGPLVSGAFGAAIEMNPEANPPGTAPVQDPELVGTMQRWGFSWGGEDAWPQGALFRYEHPPTAP